MSIFRATAASALALASALAWARPTAAASASTCANPDALGVSRIVQIDASAGQVYGSVTQAPTNDILKPGEVMLTFDDGPAVDHTRSILYTLDQHCTKATFFVVGQMAVARPALVREEIARGHTVGTHTWSHPMPMKALTPEAQIEEIDKGLAAVARVAGKGLAPFFRFPGLGDSPETLAHLGSRGIATFSVDIVTNDTSITDPQKLTERTMSLLAAKGKGILLMHDLKPSTAAALPLILAELKARNFRVVHVVPKGTGRANPLAGSRSLSSPALATAARPASPTPERLPWGLSHAGPIPTIMPNGPVQRPAQNGPLQNGPLQNGPRLNGMAVAPRTPSGVPVPAPEAHPTQAPGDSWLESVFGSNGRS